ncbi:MAG: hypothetical protein LPK45_10995, partial [Bacteroidota bacterium]|nr:hypothetical protein [Bacteroidota bacterium]MDX5431628.1 hypothetical protein [Bacteroidota bacterium]MDX5470346.1 hypothetical protein [Bacteroidota bacterium]
MNRFLFFVTLLFTTFAQYSEAATYLFKSNSSIPVNARDDLDDIRNWIDSSTMIYLNSGTALSAGHNWRLDTIAELNAPLTVNGIFYIDANGEFQLLTSKTLTVSNQMIVDGSALITGNTNATIFVAAGGYLTNNGNVDIAQGKLIIDGTFENILTASTSGTGTLQVNTGGLFINSGTYTNNGITTFASGSTFANTGSVAGANALSVPSLTVSSNLSVPHGAQYTGISFSGNFTLTAQGSLTTTTLNMTNGNLVLGDTLTVTSTLSGMSASNTIRSDGSSSLNFTGTSSGTLFVDQSTSGTTNSFNAITLNTPGTITLGNATQIDGVLTLTNGTLATGSNLTLTSNAAGSYGQIAPGSGTISGTLTMEMTATNTNAG